VDNWGADDAGDDEENGEGGGKKGLPEKTKKKLLDSDTWKRDAALVETAEKLRAALSDGLFEDHNVFLEQVDAALKMLGLKLSASDLKLIINAVSWRDEAAPPVIKKVHKKGLAADPLRGLYDAKVDGKTCVVEYEPDSELRDFEQIPFLEAPPSGLPGGLPSEATAKEGIEAFIRREVLPYTPDLPAPRPAPGQFCIYVLKCSDDSFYIGQTDNFTRRLQQHEKGEVSWTGPRLPVEPVHWEVFATRDEAVKREDDLKTGFGRQWLKKEYAAGRLYAAAARQAGAWLVEADTKIGYEVSFTRHFYQPPQLRTLAEISADILKLEQETEGLLTEITKGAKP
jgi:predicted GIY-YIG superfamily endonuclease